MENENKTSPELTAFNLMLKSLQDKYTDGWISGNTRMIKEIYFNNDCTVEQIEKWEDLIIENDNRETFKRTPPDIKFIKKMFYKATYEKKENTGDVNNHNYMLHHCKDMSVENIYKLGEHLNGIHQGSITESLYMNSFNLLHAGFLTHWQPLITEINNIVEMHGKQIFQNDHEFKKRINDVKKAILKKEFFEKFWHKDLYKKNDSQGLVDKFISGYCILKSLDEKVSMVDCKICDRDPKHLNCEYFKTQKSI